MSKTLCIDWGNTLVKAAIFNDENKMAVTEQLEAGNAPGGLDALIDEHHPDGCIFSAVVKGTQETEHAIKAKVKHFVRLDQHTALPIMNAYSSPETLGNDRIALAVGAHGLDPNKNTLVVSLGTCITFNLMMKNRAFRGGAISPGMQMRFRALHEYTDLLPQVGTDGELLLLGYDTETSVRSGVMNGIAAEIDGIVGMYAQQYPDFNAVLTGGDAPYFAGQLKTRIFADPDILMRGLQLILKHNVPQLR